MTPNHMVCPSMAEDSDKHNNLSHASPVLAGRRSGMRLFDGALKVDEHCLQDVDGFWALHETLTPDIPSHPQSRATVARSHHHGSQADRSHRQSQTTGALHAPGSPPSKSPVHGSPVFSGLATRRLRDSNSILGCFGKRHRYTGLLVSPGKPSLTYISTRSVAILLDDRLHLADAVKANCWNHNVKNYCAVWSELNKETRHCCRDFEADLDWLRLEGR
jgi:hypothetical protein